MFVYERLFNEFSAFNIRLEFYSLIGVAVAMAPKGALHAPL